GPPAVVDQEAGDQEPAQDEERVDRGPPALTQTGVREEDRDDEDEPQPVELIPALPTGYEGERRRSRHRITLRATRENEGTWSPRPATSSSPPRTWGTPTSTAPWCS